MFDTNELRRAVHLDGRVSRRLFLAYGATLAALPLWNTQSTAADRKISFPNNPFSLGVASGDPDSTSVILWTKLAPSPTEPDGGMKPEILPVQWELSNDETMANPLAQGTAHATPQLGHSVHVEATGLAPDHWYWYRFRCGDAISPIGRTRTMPLPSSNPEMLRFAFASCQHYEQGLFTAYQQMAKDNLDLVVHLGDYIYEYPGSTKRIRTHNGPSKAKIITLAEYRQRHMQYRSDPHLQAMHAKCPWFLTWDDHEFDNNYANSVSEKKGIDPATFLIQRAAAYQAYYEMMPLRESCLPKGPDLKLYRTANFGRLAAFQVLDTRQYRTDQPNGDGSKPLNEAALDPNNSLLGKEQRAWLDSRLIASNATWNVLAQQVMMGMVRSAFLGDEPKFSMDQWPGAAHERMALVKFLADRKVPNPVVLTGDIHSNWVNELRVDDRDPTTPIVATEFVGTSISSGGNGAKLVKGIDKLYADNPCVKFHNRERGYVRCTVTEETWTSDYVVVEDVLKPDGAVVTRQSFLVEAGTPGIKKA